MVKVIDFSKIDREFYGIFYKGECKDVVGWSKVFYEHFGMSQKPRLEDFRWSAGNKKNWKILKIDIVISKDQE